MSNYVEDRLRKIRAELAAVVLIAEDGEAEVSSEAARELGRIERYLERIGARVVVE